MQSNISCFSFRLNLSLFFLTYQKSKNISENNFGHEEVKDMNLKIGFLFLKNIPTENSVNLSIEVSGLEIKNVCHRKMTL